MSENKEKDEQEKEVHIEPSESEEKGTGDPGRTPGKAEGDEESAEK